MTLLPKETFPILKIRGDSVSVAASEVTLDGVPVHAARITLDLDVDRGYTMATIHLPVVPDVDMSAVLQCESVCPLGMRYRCDLPRGHGDRHRGPEGYDWADTADDYTACGHNYRVAATGDVLYCTREAVHSGRHSATMRTLEGSGPDAHLVEWGVDALERCGARRPWFGGEEHALTPCNLEAGHTGPHGGLRWRTPVTWEQQS
jgi:hypothetical protein